MKRVAIPTRNGSFACLFRADAFSVYDVDEPAGPVARKEVVDSPPSEINALEVWLRELHVSVLLAGGLEADVVNQFEDLGIRVVPGVAGGDPDQLILAYLNGTLMPWWPPARIRHLFVHEGVTRR